MKRTILAAVAAGLAMALFAQNAETPTKQKIKVCVFQPPYALNAADIDSSMQWEFDHLELCDESLDLIVLPEASDRQARLGTKEEVEAAAKKYKNRC